MTKDILIIGGGIDLFHSIQKCFMDGAVNVNYTESTEEGLWRMKRDRYCLIILGLSVLDEAGQNVVALMRKEKSIPILVVLDKVSVIDKVLALETGADDVLERPFAMEEFYARIQALLRRYMELNHISQGDTDIICLGRLLVDTGRRTIFMDGEKISLPRKEYDILVYMIKNRYRILTHEQIYEAVWKDVFSGDKSLIFYHMSQLRKQIGEGWIESVHGIGYRICDRLI